MKQYIGAFTFLIGILLTGGAIDGTANPIPYMILAIIGTGILLSSIWGKDEKEEIWGKHEKDDVFSDID